MARFVIVGATGFIGSKQAEAVLRLENVTSNSSCLIESVREHLTQYNFL